MSFLEKVDYPESAAKEYSKKLLEFVFLKTLGILLLFYHFLYCYLLSHTLKMILAFVMPMMVKLQIYSVYLALIWQTLCM